MISTTRHFSKFARPETPSRGITTERDLDIIEAILCSASPVPIGNSVVFEKMAVIRY
jgi:hypothetical protein